MLPYISTFDGEGLTIKTSSDEFPGHVCSSNVNWASSAPSFGTYNQNERSLGEKIWLDRANGKIDAYAPEYF